MNSFGWVCIKLLLLFTVCNSASAKLFYWPDQSYSSKYEISSRSNVEFNDCGTELDIFQLYGQIKITPEIIKPGDEVTIEAEGYLSETLTEGTYAKITVKLGVVTLLRKEFDLCEELRKDNNKLQCPLEKGKIVINQTVKLPKETPHAKFIINAQVFSANEDHVACEIVKVDFLSQRRPLASLNYIDSSEY